jgi:hypothetical protein
MKMAVWLGDLHEMNAKPCRRTEVIQSDNVSVFKDVVVSRSAGNSRLLSSEIDAS